MQRWWLVATLVLGSIGVSSESSAVLVAGDVAIVGRINNGSPDTFSFAPLVDLAAGDTIYFTDNGWTGSIYRGASATDGNGNEGLARFMATASISRGTLITFTNTDVTAASYTTSVSGNIPGFSGTGGNANFNTVDLSQSGDQIYAFNSAVNNPLLNPGTNLFVFDDTNGFEDATNTNQGNIAPGLTAGSTALTFNAAASTTFRLSNDGAARDRAGWLSYISAPANWTTAGTLGDTGDLLFSAVPEVPACWFGGLILSVIGIGYAGRRFCRGAQITV